MIVIVCIDDTPVHPRGATLKVLPLNVYVLPTVAVVTGIGVDVPNPNWLPRTIQAVEVVPLPGFVAEGEIPEVAVKLRMLGAAGVPVLGNIACTSFQVRGVDVAFFDAPNPTVKEIMYQSTETLPPVGGPHNCRSQPSSTEAVNEVNNRLTR